MRGVSVRYCAAMLPVQDKPDAQPPSAPQAADGERYRLGQRALAIIAAVALLAAMKLGREAIVPVLFALFLALLLSPAVEFLVRHRVVRPVAAVIVMTALLAIVAVSANATWKPARAWLETAPTTLRKLESKLRPVTGFIAKVESVSSQAERMTEPSNKSQDKPTPVAVDPKGFVESTQEWLIAIVSMLFLMFFLLATDLGSIGARGPPDSAWGQTGQVLLQVRAELGRYFGAVTLSNSILGVGTASAMYLLEMPNPLLWGVLAFLLNFVPYAGSATTLVLLTVVALVSFDGVGKAFAVAGTYLVLTTLEGQVLQPVLVGRRLDLSPLIVLLGLWFGGWLWGVAGVALAMPVLVSVKAAAQEIARSRTRAEQAREADTVRSRASDWLRQSAGRYRRPPRAATR
jgi:predicted PurR-regulated permease PerM